VIDTPGLMPQLQDVTHERPINWCGRVVALALLAVALPAVAAQAPVTAIDILLEPDATMLQHAKANNERLLKAYPRGFALDAAHNPHVTLVSGVAPKEYLDRMLAEPFEPFAFSPAGAAAYQLGPYGTAAKKLVQFNLNP
jgi:hypothetical protein